MIRHRSMGISVARASALGFAACFILADCSPFEKARFGSGSQSSVKPMTYNAILSQFVDNGTDGPNPQVPPPGPSPTPMPTPMPNDPPVTPPPVTHPIKIVPAITDLCTNGEVDIADAAYRCMLPADLIITVKDEYAEQTLSKITLDRPYDGIYPETTSRSLVAALSAVRSATFSGSEADVFLCIDSNRDGRCSDELVVNINDISFALITTPVPGAGSSDGGSSMGGGPRWTSPMCARLQKGMILFHEHVKAQGGAGASVPSPSEMTGRTVQQSLTNIQSAQQVTASGEYRVPMPLVRSNPAVCPPPDPGPQVNPDMNPRDIGCFVRGTKLRVNKNVSVPVESFRIGSPIQLANGRVVRIKSLVAGPEIEPVITFTTAGPRITVTSKHPLMTEGGVKLARDISITDKLKGVDGKYLAITSISQKAYADKVFNVELTGDREEDHLIIAEGLVSGDLYLQIKLTKVADEAPVELIPNLLSFLTAPSP